MMGIRTELAAFLETLVDPATVVYAYPVELPVVPSLVIVPGSEYVTPLTFGRDGTAETVAYSFEIRILTLRTLPDEALDAVETLRKAITDGISGFPGARWMSFGEIGETTVGDIPTLGGTVEIAIRTGDQI